MKDAFDVEKKSSGLAEALGLGRKEHVALVGGGGKTTLMFALAAELQRSGKRVISTTTTKVWEREATRAPRVVLAERDPGWRQRLRAALDEAGHVFLGRDILDTGKVEGIGPTLADELNDWEIDCLIVEADGAAGHPVKAPTGREPVIPASATKVVAVMGLDAIGRNLGPDVAFRLERVQELTGLKPGERLTPAALSRLFLLSRGLFKGTGKRAERVAFLNRLDQASDANGGKELARILLADTQDTVNRVVIGSLKKGTYFVEEKRP